MSNARKLADNLPSVGQLGGRNAVINGEFNVSQRGTSFTNIGSGGGGTSGYDDTYTMDRFLISQGLSAGRCTVTQDSSTPTGLGFSKSLKIATTTADTSIAAGEYHRLQTKFEGQNLQRFAKGTTGAKEFTLSFYCKANAAATYVVELSDTDNTRSVGKTFSVTTDWTKVIITFPADTTGAFNNDNNLSLELNWWFHAGSTYSSGTLATTWVGTVPANRAAGISSIFDSTSRTFFITGVQLEVGPQSTPFEHRSFGQELALCQRYLIDLTPDSGTSPYFPGTAACANTTVAVAHMAFPVQMRATPALVMTAGNYRIYNGSTHTVTAIAINGMSPVGGGVNFSVTSSMGTAQAVGVYSTGTGIRSLVTAEL